MTQFTNPHANSPHREAVLRIARECRDLALDLTLRNPLLKLPKFDRSLRFIPLRGGDATIASKVLLAAQRNLLLLGSDCGKHDTEQANRSRSMTAGMLRLVVDLPSEKLAARLAKIRKQSEELIEKRGVPCGYVTSHVLHWVSADGQQCEAPLVLIPVDIVDDHDASRLERKIVFAPGDRDTTMNQVLFAYLRRHFNIDAPKLEEGCELTPAEIERWIRQLEPICQSRTGWRIEKQSVIGLFDCGAISVDCDPERWENSIGESATLTTVMLGTASDEQRPTDREFLPQTLVLEADGSQLHALDLAVHGKNLVIHGPPGSGKSQTIVNLIAQAMASGKSVLFVAQKPQAAMVVLDRMRRINLDAFCTSLMPIGSGSRANLKHTVLEGLTRRLQVRARRTSQDLQKRQQLNQAVQLLEDHASALRHVLPQFGRSAREIVAELALLEEARTDRFDRDDLVEPASPGKFAEATVAIQHLVALRADIPKDAMATVSGIGAIHDSTNPNSQAAQLRDLTERLFENLESAIRAIDRLASIGIRTPSDSLRTLTEWAHSQPELGLADDPRAMEMAARLHRHGAREAFKRLTAAKRAMRGVVQSVPEARRRVSGLDVTDSATWRSALGTIDGSVLTDVAIESAGQLGAVLETVARRLQATLLTGAASTSARALTGAPNYHAWRARLTLMSQLDQGRTHSTFLCDAVSRGSPSSAQLSVLAQTIRRVEAARTLAGRRLALAEIPDLQELERLQAVLGHPTSSLGRMWAFFTSRVYRECRSAFTSMVRLPIKRRDWNSELQGAIDLRHAEQAYADQVAEWGYSVKAVKVAELEAGRDWLSGIERTAQAAEVSMSEIWQIMRERLDPALQVSEVDVGTLCSSIVRDGKLLQIMSSLAGTEEFRLQRFLRVLSDAASAASLGFKQANSWQLDGDVRLDAVIRLGLAAASAHELETACQADSDARELVGAEFAGVDSVVDQLELVFAWHGMILMHPSAEWQRTISQVLTDRSTAPQRMTILKECAGLLRRTTQTAEHLCTSFGKAFEMRGAASILMPSPDKSLPALVNGLSTLREHQASIPKVLRHHAAAIAARPLVGNGLIDRYLDNAVDCDRIAESFQASTYRLALESNAALRPLVGFDRKFLERSLLQLRDLDEELRSTNAEMIRLTLAAREVPQGIDIGLVRDKTQLGLVRHVVRTPNARLDLTGLYKRAGAAIRALQPCTIATPTTVSEYLPRQVADFDLVILDEASQIEPASAIGSIARGAQVIIVGDPKQLPPTNFFGGTRMVGGDGDPEDHDDEADGVADVESILDRAIGALRNVHLRGHYRSKHHSLIEYSNRHFYDSQLVVPPSTVPRSPQYGVVAHHIADAYYSASENEVEAQAVAAAVLRHVKSSPSESLGVVAFNARQAELIERHILALARRSREDFEAFVKAREDKTPLFVRNLESVQGDERDVIFISYTYGRDPVAKVVHQRFGPLTHQGGGRRLNVLVTRARNRVEVFHSLEPNEITGQTGGVPLMRAYLQHAMRDARHDFLEGSYESAFEERVAAIVTEINPALVVKPQVGCEGFRIDLGVALQSAPHRFILGIECDGAIYHSEPSARQRDMIRQIILEQHGWTIHRIWSTAWWHNFPEERNRLVRAIESAVAASGVASPGR